MKYTHVVFIWLLADVLLGIGSFVYATRYNEYGTTMLFWSVTGFIYSLPSLLIMLIFHIFYEKYAKNPANYVLPYSILILGINILYLSAGFIFSIDGSDSIYHFNSFYKIFIATTVAGFLSFYLVNMKIKKNNKHIQII